MFTITDRHKFEKTALAAPPPAPTRRESSTADVREQGPELIQEVATGHLIDREPAHSQQQFLDAT